LQILTERKRKQLHLEATERKAFLESEIAATGQQIQELQARKAELETELRTVAKSLGLSAGGGERAVRRKPKKSEEPAPTEE